MRTAFARRVAIVLLAFSISSGCLKRETPVQAGIRTQTLLLGNGYEPADLDPHITLAVADARILYALFEGLTWSDETTGRGMPAAAERWDVSPDGRTYTFHLRPNLRWSNGDPLTAHDFVFAFQRLLNPKLAAQYAYMLWPLKGAKAFNQGTTVDFMTVGAKAIAPHTLQLELENPTPYLPSLVAHWTWLPVHRATLEKFSAVASRGTKWTRPGNLVGNGPFTLAEWRPHARIVVNKNTHYWDAGATRLNTIVFFPNEESVDESNFRAGQVHKTAVLPMHKLANYRNEAPERVQTATALITYFVWLNVTQPPLDNRAVRRALSLAIDRAAIARAVYFDAHLPAKSVIPPNCGGYTAPAGPECDPPAARRLLAEAGYAGGKGLPEFSMEIINAARWSKLAEAIQAMWWRELGVHVTLQQRDEKTALENWQQKRYALALMDWGADFPDPASFLEVFVTGGGYNSTGWSNAEYDRLIADAAKTAEPRNRFELFQQAERLLLEEVPVAPLIHLRRVFLLHPAVKGWKPALFGFNRYQDIVLEGPSGSAHSLDMQ